LVHLNFLLPFVWLYFSASFSKIFLKNQRQLELSSLLYAGNEMIFKFKALTKNEKELTPIALAALNTLFESLKTLISKFLIIVSGIRTFAAISLQNNSTLLKSEVFLMSSSMLFEIPVSAIHM